MSVYTPLSLAQVQQFASQFALDIVDLKPIQGGIQNTNYFLIAADGTQYVLTLFEQMDADDVASLFPALQQLAKSSLPMALPLSIDGQAVFTLADKPAQIAPRIYGEHPEPSATVGQAQAIGHALATLHMALKDVDLDRENTHGDIWLAETSALLYKEEMTPAQQQLMDTVLTAYQNVQQQYPNRPKGLIHADLFRDNTLYQGDTLSGMLDFFEINRDEFLLDISIAINDFCSDYPNIVLNDEKYQAFLHGYQQIRPLTDDEQAALPVYLAMAAFRFWMLRLDVARMNRLQGRTGADILQKDPEQMRAMLEQRLQRAKV
ncbi:MULTISPECIES: homoserine kinase [unclassified Acinetobacter]|uniref:homoserine kinase n=1 Tax=unclassified Acinetobacter TaxID=196816 RepID=UPI0035BA2013